MRLFPKFLVNSTYLVTFCAIVLHPAVFYRHCQIVQNSYNHNKYNILKVFDILGNEVATLVNGEKPAGKYEIIFKADKLSSGVYLYQLRTGNSVQSRKMILFK